MTTIWPKADSFQHQSGGNEDSVILRRHTIAQILLLINGADGGSMNLFIRRAVEGSLFIQRHAAAAAAAAAAVAVAALAAVQSYCSPFCHLFSSFIPLCV